MLLLGMLLLGLSSLCFLLLCSLLLYSCKKSRDSRSILFGSYFELLISLGNLFRRWLAHIRVIKGLLLFLLLLLPDMLLLGMLLLGMLLL